MADVKNIFEQFDRGKERKFAPLESDDNGVVAGQPRAYVAFKPVDRRQLRVKIRPAAQAWERVPYRYLLRIMENSDQGTDITLVFTFMAIVIEGRNLQLVADAIDRELCVFMQEFDPVRFDKPADRDAPFIGKITIYAMPASPEADAAQAKAKVEMTPA